MLSGDEVVAVNAWSSSHYGNKADYGAQLAWKGGSTNNKGFFHSKEENNPWLIIELNRPVNISAVTITNREDCCGERLKNLEVRGGMTNETNDVTNPVIGEFKGPGTTGGVHLIPLKKPSEILFLKFQLKSSNAVLQINGINVRYDRGKNRIFLHLTLE